MRGLREGRYKLLYVAPERLMMQGFLATLRGLDVRAVAVDEAHCISAWGHDFRPEYRRLAELRDVLPGVPIMALSATATERVREDIAESLRMRAPRCYVASFDRPNLLYRVDGKADALGQILALLRRRRGEAGIVYAQSRKAVERLAEKLREAGVDAAAYHAGMDAADRARTQERFTRDEVRVICATVAFGMGIDKPNVRFVVHHDLPKDLESYYQETGRAGRDGLPSECLLLFNPGDAVKQARFIDEKSDPEERARARQKLTEAIHFAESGECRRVALLSYFGEAREGGPCGACDNCLSPRERWDGTVEAQKLLSCVLRIRQKSDLVGRPRARRRRPRRRRHREDPPPRPPRALHLRDRQGPRPRDLARDRPRAAQARLAPPAGGAAPRRGGDARGARGPGEALAGDPHPHPRSARRARRRARGRPPVRRGVDGCPPPPPQGRSPMRATCLRS